MFLKLLKSRSMWRVNGLVGRGESTVNDDGTPPLYFLLSVLLLLLLFLLSFSCPLFIKFTLSILCEKNINGYLGSSIHRKSAKVTVSTFGLFWYEPARVAFTCLCYIQQHFYNVII